MRKKLSSAGKSKSRKESEKERFASFPKLNPNPVMELDSSGKITFANKATLEVVQKAGFKSPSRLLPRDIKKILKFLNRGVEKHVYREVSLGQKFFGESIHWAPQFNAAHIYARDITEKVATEQEFKKLNFELESKVRQKTVQLQHYNRALSVLSACNKALIYSQNEKDLLKEICRVIVEIGKYRWAWIGSAEKNEQKSVKAIAQMGFESGYLESANISWSEETSRGRGPIGKAVRTGEVLVGKNFSKDADLAPWRTEARKRGFGSVIALPLKSSGETFGVLVIYAEEPNAFDRKEIKLLHELSEDLAFGINTLREREHHAEAEALVRASNELMTLSNLSSSRQEYLDDVVRYLKKWSGCAFVGIRILQKEEFIPYESYTGFSHDFWQSENMLSLKKDQCACIRVISGKPDPQDREAMTKVGSFYTNDSAEFIAGLSKKEQSRFRGKCIRCGFASLAVVPIRRKEIVLGAIHIADKKPGRLPLKKIEMLEVLSLLIGEAVNKFNAQERLVESYKYLGTINRKIPLLLEMDRQSKNGKKKDISQYVLDSSLNISKAKAGFLYRHEEDGEFRLLASFGIPEREKANLRAIRDKEYQKLKKIAEEKDSASEISGEQTLGRLNLNGDLKCFLALPLKRRRENKLKGFLLLGFPDAQCMDPQELEFYDVFSMHASSALLGAEVLK